MNQSTYRYEPKELPGHVESFNARMRDEVLDGELFGNLYEAKVLTNRWVSYYNTIRPPSSLSGKTPAPQTYTFDDLEMTEALCKSVWNVMIIDEVFGGGGKYVTKKCEDALLSYLADHKNCALIMTSNSASFAKKIGGRGIVLDKGSIAFDGNVVEAVNIFKSRNIL